VGVFNRIDEIWDAGFEVGRTGVGTIGDLVQAPFTDDEYEGFIGTMWGVAKDRGADQIVNLIGPEGVGGEIIEALPEGVRAPGRSLIKGLEWGYREIVGDPLSGFVTAVASYFDGAEEDTSIFLTGEAPDDWVDHILGFTDRLVEGYKVAQERSPGQAVVLAFAAGDVFDPNAGARFEGTAWYTLSTGTLDAMSRWFLSPDVLAFKAGSARRASNRAAHFANYFGDAKPTGGALSSGVRAQAAAGRKGTGFERFSDDVVKLATESPELGALQFSHIAQRLAVLRVQATTLRNRIQVLKVQNKTIPEALAVDAKAAMLEIRELQGMADDSVAFLAGRVKEKFLKSHHDGDLVAHEAAAAFLGANGWKGGVDDLESVMRFFMGEATALERIAQTAPEAFPRLAHLWKTKAWVPSAHPPGTPGADAVAFLHAQMGPKGTWRGVEEDLLIGLYGTLDKSLVPTSRVNLGDRMMRSDWLRDPDANLATRVARTPVRVFKDMKNQQHIWAGDPNSGEHMIRQLQESGLYTADEMTSWRGKWAASRDVGRPLMADEKQAELLIRMLEKHLPDLSPDDIDRLLTDFRISNKSAQVVMRDAQMFDAENSLMKVVDNVTGETMEIFSPLTPSQLKNSFILFDVRQMNRELKRFATKGFAQPNAAGEFTKLALQEVMSLWKAAQLLRPAWVFRVVGDEQFRMMAKIGSMARLSELLKNDRGHYVRAAMSRKVVKDGEVSSKAVRKLLGFRAGVTGGLGYLVGGLPVAAGFALASGVRNVHNVRRLTRRVGDLNRARALVRTGEKFSIQEAQNILKKYKLGNMDILGYEVEAAFGDAFASASQWTKLNSASNQAGYLLLQEERKFYEGLDATFGGAWNRVFDPTDGKEFNNFWERVVNDQWANNPVGAIAFRTHSLNVANDQAIRVRNLEQWLETGPGRAFKNDNKLRFRNDPDGEVWAQQVVEAADRMLDPTLARTLRDRLADGGRVTIDDVRAHADDLRAQGTLGPGDDWRELVGPVHGQELEIASRPQSALEALHKPINAAYERLGSLGTDHLSRNPYFRHVYQNEMKRRIGKFQETGGEYVLDHGALRSIEASARRKALMETRDLLYDLAESSRFADLVHNLMPFYNAWQEVLTRWAGLAWENPVWVSHARMVLEGEVDLGDFMQTVEDDRGERYYQFRVPEFARGLVKNGFANLAGDDFGLIRFRADSLNMVTQGLPGFGPLIQYPASKLVMEKPQLMEALQFMLPYGPVDSLRNTFLPAYGERIYSALSQDRAHESQVLRLMMHRMTEMAEGERDEIDFSDGDAVAAFIQEAQSDGRNFMLFRAVASAFSPAQVGFSSPYQPYIEKYREMKRKDPKGADDEFMRYLMAEGQAGFFTLAARTTRNNEGLPSTIEAVEIREKYQDLINTYPSLGSLILGIEGGGAAKFNAAVYERQLNEETFPGSGVTRRERLTPYEMIVDVREREGWATYGMISDVIQTAMQAQGLRNLRGKAGKPLAQLKRVVVSNLAERYPLWYRDLRDPELSEWPERIEGMRAIVADERLSGRQDIESLGGYLAARDMVTGVLAYRAASGGASTLSAEANTDLRLMWETVTDNMIENPTFSDLFWRWLEYDKLLSETWPPEQKALKLGKVAG
jgi:hypothetical protein